MLRNTKRQCIILLMVLDDFTARETDFTQCRLCFVNKKMLIYIFEVSGCLKNVAKTIIDVLNYEVTTEDHFPPFVCTDCSDKLYEFKSFKVKCDSLRETYKQLLNSRSDFQSPFEIDIKENEVPIFDGCLECPKIHALKHHLNQHMSMHKESRPFSCKECGKAFKLKTHLKQHALVHSKNQMYQCEHCELGFRTKWQHDNHQKSHEGKVLWKCSLCDEKLKTWVEYGEHMLYHKRNKMYCCDICSKEYYSKKSPRNHILNHIKPFECSECDKHFGSRKFLQLHMRTSTRPYACKICGKSFSRSSGRQAHMVTHSDARPFKCRFCDHRSKTKIDLKRHERSHGPFRSSTL